MDTKQEIIRRYYREGDSQRKISRDLQISRETVNHYLVGVQEAQTACKEKGTEEPLQEYLCGPPTYNSSNRSKRKLTDEIQRLIRVQMADNERKKREGLRKQIKRKIDIYEYILKEGHQIGYTTVCNYLRQLELKTQEAFVRQAHLPGEECEFDWAEVKLVIGEEQRRLQLAVYTSNYSNYRYGDLYSRQDSLAYMESHSDLTQHVGGVFHEMIYDNMRITISNFVGRTEKHPSRALVSLSGWYQFRWRFCNVQRGNEKGHVERSVEIVRRKAFSDKDHFASMEEAREHLKAVLERLNMVISPEYGKTPLQMLEEERAYLWKNPGPMECYMEEWLKVDKYSTFCYGTNRYSVPDYLVGRLVRVKVYSNRLKVYGDKEVLDEHERNYGRNQWIIKIDHYMRTLSRKPGALARSLALQRAPELIRQMFHDFFRTNARSFIDLLMYCKEKGISHGRLQETVMELARICPKDVSADKVMMMLGNQSLITTPANGKDSGSEIETCSRNQLQEISLMVNPANCM